MLLKVKTLRHEIGYNTIKFICSKIVQSAAIHKTSSPTGKVTMVTGPFVNPKGTILAAVQGAKSLFHVFFLLLSLK